MNQMQRTQVGTVGALDRTQTIRDTAREKRQSTSSRMQEKQDTIQHSPAFLTSSSDEILESSSGDEVKQPPQKKKKLIDIMSTTATTGDRLGLSYRQRAMYAAAVARAMEVDVDETNISVSSSQ